MIDFSKAIRMDKIATMSSKELSQLKDVLTPSETKSAMTQIKETLAKGETLWDLPVHVLMDALEIKMNSVGYHHYALNGTYYDLYQIAEKLAKHYQHDVQKRDIANALYEIDFYGYGDDDE